MSNIIEPPLLAIFFTNSESFKGLSLDLYRFYLVTLPLGTRWAFVKYHIKPLSMIKKTRFSPWPLWIRFVFIPVEITWRLRGWYLRVEPKGILKNPVDFYRNLKKPNRFLLKPSWLLNEGLLVKSVWRKYNIIYETQKILRKNIHPYTIICQSMKITVRELPLDK